MFCKILLRFPTDKKGEIYYRPQTKLRKGNVFTPFCQSFCSQGGVPASVYAGIHPPGRHPPADTPPPADGYCCGRYASYWNAFLFKYTIRFKCGIHCISCNKSIYLRAHSLLYLNSLMSSAPKIDLLKRNILI